MMVPDRASESQEAPTRAGGRLGAKWHDNYGA